VSKCREWGRVREELFQYLPLKSPWFRTPHLPNYLSKANGPDLEARKSLYPTEAPPRFELGVEVLQTSALPLGYGAGRLD
jgi:hypothetical protein